MPNLLTSLLSALLGGAKEEQVEREGGGKPSRFRLRRPLSPPPAPPRPSPVPPSTPAVSPAGVEGGSPDLSTALRRIFDHRDPTHAGSLHLLGLESLHERLGTHWPHLAGRVHQLTQRLLTQHLSPHDAWFRHGEEAYVVVFAHLGAEQARLICAKVVEELQILLLGNADTASITVRSAMHELGSEMVLVPANLKQMLESAADRQAPAAAVAIADPVPDPSGKGFRHGAQAAAGPSQVRYRPVWDVSRQVLSLYMARCSRVRTGRSPLWGYECLEDPASAPAILAQDLWVAREAVDVALELHENRFRFILSLPIHFESLAGTQRRQELTKALREIPKHLTPFVAYHLYGVPAGAPSGRLAELVSAVRPFGRTVMVEAEQVTADLSAIGGSGARVVNFTLPPGASAERWRQDIVRFASNAARHQLLAAVEGVRDLAMEDVCEEAGIGFLSGDLIGGWVEVPEHVVRKSRTDFVRQRPSLGGE